MLFYAGFPLSRVCLGALPLGGHKNRPRHQRIHRPQRLRQKPKGLPHHSNKSRKLSPPSKEGEGEPKVQSASRKLSPQPKGGRSAENAIARAASGHLTIGTDAVRSNGCWRDKIEWLLVGEIEWPIGRAVLDKPVGVTYCSLLVRFPGSPAV